MHILSVSRCKYTNFNQFFFYINFYTFLNCKITKLQLKAHFW